MPVRRAESLMTLREQCRAPNSLADSRHQTCLASDRRAFRGRQARDVTVLDRPPSIGIVSRSMAAKSILFLTP